MRNAVGQELLNILLYTYTVKLFFKQKAYAFLFRRDFHFLFEEIDERIGVHSREPQDIGVDEFAPYAGIYVVGDGEQPRIDRRGRLDFFR